MFRVPILAAVAMGRSMILKEDVHPTLTRLPHSANDKTPILKGRESHTCTHVEVELPHVASFCFCFGFRVFLSFRTSTPPPLPSRPPSPLFYAPSTFYVYRAGQHAVYAFHKCLSWTKKLQPIPAWRRGPPCTMHTITKRVPKNSGHTPHPPSFAYLYSSLSSVVTDGFDEKRLHF